MKSALFFIADIVEAIEGSDIDQLIEDTGLHEDDIDEFLDNEEVQQQTNAFLLLLASLGYRISGRDGQVINYITDVQGYDDKDEDKDKEDGDE